jgi:hypothetical protein
LSDEVKKLITHSGGQVVAKVDESCTYVVAEDMRTLLAKKAAEKGIPVVLPGWVSASISAGTPSTDEKYFLTKEEEKNDAASFGLYAQHSAIAGPCTKSTALTHRFHLFAAVAQRRRRRSTRGMMRTTSSR